ncbi:MAG TPA: 2Fe-2S iron-sulfur cluster-binding protein [Flavobacterium sp.]|nr:2Fe-2S iron-sulfur cluster-binding protein [Flavobacterium sp.]
MASYKKLIVAEVKRETKDAVSILFNVPDELKSHYNFVAGQYINVRLKLDDKEVRRAYSIYSPPASGELRIAVKAIENGSFSQFANQKLKTGDVLEVGKPEGKFIFEPETDRQNNYVAFVAGSGITPVLSIVKSVLLYEPKSSFVLVYGNKSPQDTIFFQELHDLQLKYLSRFYVHFVYSQSSMESVLKGRIGRETVNYVLSNKYSQVNFSKFYLCGPEEMIDIICTVLKEKNVSESAIKYELFTSSVQEKTIEEFYKGHSKISIKVDDEETSFEMSQNQSILDAVLKQGIDAPYSCQGGICCSCVARVTHGTAQMIKNGVLSENEIAEGLILTCQAYPTSEEIRVDYDDV